MSDVASVYKDLTQQVKQLTELSIDIQQSLGEGDLSNLPENMSERQRVFDKIVKRAEELQGLESDSGNLDPATTQAKTAFHSEIECYLHIDTILLVAIESSAHSLAVQLVESVKRRAGALNYRHVEKTTDLVARIFPGNSRRFDENL